MNLKITKTNKKLEFLWNILFNISLTKSDIDWSKLIPEIDKQLYKKYNLTQEEIDFIESKVKPME